MFATPRRRLALLAALAFVVSLLTPTIGRAQNQARVRLSPPDLSEFPTVSFLLSALDAEGRRLAELQPDDVQVLEDGEPRPIQAMELVEVGSQQLFVINGNQGMGIRDSRGRTRFHFVRESLFDWWSRPAASSYGTNNLTLVVGETALVESGQSAATLAAALDEHQPIFSADRSGLSSLLDALRFLDSSAAEPDRPSFVVYFTSLPGEPEALTLTNLIDRARQLGTVIYPVLIDVPEAAESEEAEPLRQIAQATGGQVFSLDPAEPALPDLIDLVAGQRKQHRVTYQSALSQSGSHELQVRVQTGVVSVQSEPRSFEMRVQPPDIAFIQPPRSLRRAAEDPAVGVAQLPPTEQQIDVLITFPDGNPRPISSSRLLADGEVIAERSSAPFDSFIWNLRELSETQTVDLTVEVTDSLGLQASTVIHVVEVTVVPPPGGLAALRPALGSLLLVIAVLVAGTLGAIVLVSYSRRNQEDVEAGPAAGGRPLRRAQLQPEADRSSAEALLVPEDENGQTGEPIALTGADITLGSDASLAVHPFSDPSVSSIHARVIRQAGGQYLIRDQGSIAGTWVNSEEVPEDGHRLVHGDIVQLGRVKLRFRLPNPPKQATVRIETIDTSGARAAESEAK